MPNDMDNKIENDFAESFWQATTAERLQRVRDPQQAGALRAYFGDAAFAEYKQLADDYYDGAHLSIAHATNLIFVPGVMGSLLHSRTRGGVWWLDLRALAKLDELKLAADGKTDLDANNRIEPFNVDATYEPFLSAALARNDFGHDVFAYDWRKPLRASAAALRDLIVRTYEGNGGEPVHLVGHSMGGLMIRTALLEHGAELWPKLGRIVFIGTPHYGAPAIAGYVKNHLWGFEALALLGRYLSRQTFRSLWGVLSLLPAPRGIYPGTRPGDGGEWSAASNDEYRHPGGNFDFYQAGEWNLDLLDSERAQLQAALDDAAATHRRLYDFHMGLNQTQRDRMLMIAGVGQETLFRLMRTSRLFLWEGTSKETNRIAGDPHREGDGRVPLASAELEFVTMRYVKGVHGGLTNIPAVYADVFHWLKEERLELPETPAEALSRHLAADDLRSATPTLDGSARAQADTNAGGLWDESRSTPERLDQLQRELEAGRLPEFINVRIL